jgi:hypothetical protein
MQDSDEKRITHLFFDGDFIAIVTSSAAVDGKNSTGKRRDVSSSRDIPTVPEGFGSARSSCHV